MLNTNLLSFQNNIAECLIIPDNHDTLCINNGNYYESKSYCECNNVSSICNSLIT